jgi:phosphoglycolate phosphatase-like HAD superfamily hydrolase
MSQRLQIPMTIGSIKAQISALVFDKDGTLVDFNRLWSHKIELWLDALVEKSIAAMASPRPVASLQAAFESTLGYDRRQRVVVPDSPLAVASLPRLYGVAMTVMYQNSVPWHVAETLSEQLWRETNHTIHPAHVKAVGKVAEAFEYFYKAGLGLGVITSDDRSSTLQTLPLLKIEQFVESIVCGDDPLPNKPAPDGLFLAAETLRTKPEHMIMVGDTVSDMVCGRAAGVAACIGVRGGAGDEAAVKAAADLMIDQIDDLVPLLFPGVVVP